MILRDSELLKEWLIPRLSPICHTDPIALADYIISLIKKDKPVQALRNICVVELEVFLQRETVPLVERLFEVLEGELYLAKTSRILDTEFREKSHASVKTPDRLKTRLEARTKSEPDMDTQGRVKRMKEGVGPNSKRSLGEVMHGHASLRVKDKTRNIRKSHDSNRSNLTTNKQFYSSDDDSILEFEDTRGETEDESPIFEETHRPGRCKDYDEKGYCLLGNTCSYDHGSDPVVLEPAYTPTHPPLQVPLPMPLIAPAIIPINPSDPRLILPPTVTQLPISTPTALSVSVSRPISVTDGYNPENPAYDSIDGDNTVPISGAHGIPPPVDLDTKPIQSQAKYINNMHSVSSVDSVHMTTISNGGNKKYPHPNQLSTALILRKVPIELNSVAKLSNYFDKFGTVVNVQVRYDNDPEGALVRFVTPQEAKKAHDCSDAVLGNRFIRVFYSKRDRNTSYPPKLKSFEITSPIELATVAATGPANTIDIDTEEKEQFSPEDLETPTTILTESLSLSNISTDHCQPQIMHKAPTIDPKMIEKRLEIHRRKQELLDQFLKQQKVLFGMLSKSSSQIEKERIKIQMKAINEKMDNFRTSSEQVEALRTETARMANHSAKEKKKQELRQNGDTARAIRGPGHAHKDLRGIISRKPRSLLILSIKPTEKDELMTYLERFGIIEQVNFKPEENQLMVTYRSRQEAEKLVHSTYPFKGRNLIMKWSAPKKPLRSQLKYVNARHANPGYMRFSHPGMLEMAGERSMDSSRDLLTPDFNTAFGTEQALLLEETSKDIESNDEIQIQDDGFGSIGSPSEIDYFNFLEPKVSMCEDSENDEEEEVYWRRRDKV